MDTNRRNTSKRTSVIWNFYCNIDKDKYTAECNLCNSVMSYRSSISNLKKHLSRRHTGLLSSLKGFAEEHNENDGHNQSASVSAQVTNPSTNNDIKSGSIGCTSNANQRLFKPHLESVQISSNTQQVPVPNAHSTFANIEDKEDEYDLVGRNIAAKLRKMNFHQRVLAESLMQQIVTKGLFEELTRNTNIETTYPMASSSHQASSTVPVEDNIQENETYAFTHKYDIDEHDNYQ